MLQCVAVCCCVLQYVVVSRTCYTLTVLQCVARVVVCCSVLQCVAVFRTSCTLIMLQCVAECCSVLQYVAVCCSVLHCVAACCSVSYIPHTLRVLQCGAVCCSVLQCVVVCCTVDMGWLRWVGSLKLIVLFCRIYSLLYGSFAEETCNFKEPTNRSHPVVYYPKPKHSTTHSITLAHTATHSITLHHTLRHSTTL